MTRPKYRFDVPLYRDMRTENLGGVGWNGQNIYAIHSDVAEEHDYYEVATRNRHEAMKVFRDNYVDDMEYELSAEEDEEDW